MKETLHDLVLLREEFATVEFVNLYLPVGTYQYV